MGFGRFSRTETSSIIFLIRCYRQLCFFLLRIDCPQIKTSRSSFWIYKSIFFLKHFLTASRKVVYVLVKMIFLPSMVDLNHETKILWKSYYELNAEKIETRKNLRKIFHPERACLTAPLKILMTIFLEFQIRAENIYFQKPSFFSEFAWILTFVFIFLV